jgi:hypothetical protein
VQSCTQSPWVTQAGQESTLTEVTTLPCDARMTCDDDDDDDDDDGDV